MPRAVLSHRPIPSQAGEKLAQLDCEDPLRDGDDEYLPLPNGVWDGELATLVSDPAWGPALVGAKKGRFQSSLCAPSWVRRRCGRGSGTAAGPRHWRAARRHSPLADRSLGRMMAVRIERTSPWSSSMWLISTSTRRSGPERRATARREMRLHAASRRVLARLVDAAVSEAWPPCCPPGTPSTATEVPVILGPPLSPRLGDLSVGVHSREANNTELFIVERTEPTCLNYGTWVASNTCCESTSLDLVAAITQKERNCRRAT